MSSRQNEKSRVLDSGHSRRGEESHELSLFFKAIHVPAQTHTDMKRIDMVSDCQGSFVAQHSCMVPNFQSLRPLYT